MLNKFKVIFLLVLFCGSNMYAQKQLNQVYSRYGIGEKVDGGTTRNISMGGTGLASPSKFSINDKNPSLMVYNSAISFEFNFKNEFRSSISTSGDIYKDNEAGVGDIRIAFPIYKNKWQTLFELKQFSKTNYNLFEISSIGPVSDSLYNYETVNGQGGVNQFNWKNGFKVNKNLNLGLGISYYIGETKSFFDSRIKTTPNDFSNTNAIAPNSISTAIINDRQYKGLSTTAYFSYYKRFDSSFVDLFFGGKFDLTSNFDIVNNGITYKVGTLNDTVESTNPYSIPKGFGLGIGVITKDSLQRNKFMLAFDFTSNRFFVSPTANLRTTTYAFGIEKFENINSNSIFSRNLYRAGGYFSKNAILFQETGIDEFGITFGIGIPMKPSINDRSVRSILDFGFTWGAHGGAQNTIKESFFKFNLSYTFSDRWFRKIKIN